MATVSANEVIGKTLFAKMQTALKRAPRVSQATIYTVMPGNPIGTVFSYVGPDETTDGLLWWAFKDKNGKTFYASHESGKYDFKALKDQGVKTTAEKIKEEERKNEPVTAFIERNIKTIAIVVGGGIVLKTLIPELFKAARRK